MARTTPHEGTRLSLVALSRGATPGLQLTMNRPTRVEAVVYFVITVLGFSFWFFMAVPFASHRETYWWLAMVDSESFAHAFSFISSTYRPLHQGATWLAFDLLRPDIFPTSVPRQALLQLLVYGVFVLAWWFIYSAAPQRRLFALVAFVTGGVFFSGYVHLFHVYGLAYVPVMLTVGALLWARATGTFERQEVWFAGVATLLVLWHPFATALFLGFYFGYYLDTLGERGRGQHVKAVVILLVSMAAVAAIVVGVPRLWPDASPLLVQTATRPVTTRLLGFLVSYQTNEVNPVASLVAFMLTEMVLFSMGLARTLKWVSVFFAAALSIVFLVNGLPLLTLWVCVVLIKLLFLRCWGLFFLMLTAALLPFGGGIGTPIYALFAIIIAAYVTCLGWSRAEQALSFVKTRYVIGAAVAVTVVLLMVRMGVEVPIVTRGARPLLAERERTYQLETILAWLHNSPYCSYEIDFDEPADNPIDSVESAITRRNRPPASLGDVRLFWKTILQCRKAEQPGTAVLTFGGSGLSDSRSVFEARGRYAGNAAVWIREAP